MKQQQRFSVQGKTLPSSAEVFKRLKARAFGRDNAMHAVTLSRLLRISHKETAAGHNGAGQELRGLVAKAVSEGFPICSGRDGYWVPQTSAELRTAALSLQARADRLSVRAAALRQSFDKMIGATA